MIRKCTRTARCCRAASFWTTGAAIARPTSMLHGRGRHRGVHPGRATSPAFLSARKSSPAAHGSSGPRQAHPTRARRALLPRRGLFGPRCGRGRCDRCAGVRDGLARVNRAKQPRSAGSFEAEASRRRTNGTVLKNRRSEQHALSAPFCYAGIYAAENGPRWIYRV